MSNNITGQDYFKQEVSTIINDILAANHEHLDNYKKYKCTITVEVEYNEDSDNSSNYKIELETSRRT